MPQITPGVSTAGEVGVHALRPTARWAWLGLGVCAALLVTSLVTGALVADGGRAAANVAGSFALAPTVTAIGGSRRHVLAVGALGLVLAAAMCVLDGVPALTGTVRCLVVVTTTLVVTAVAGVRQRHLAQLTDRRQAARTLQAAMLTELPQPDHLQLASRYLPASVGDQVGGDWYDALVDADGSTLLVIGDVTGHDIGAAATMGQVRAVLRAYAVEGGQQPSTVLTRTETALERLGLDVLASAAVVRVDQSEQDAALGLRRVVWSSAGHPPLVLLTWGPDDEPVAVPLAGMDDADLLLGVGGLAGPRRDRSHVLPPHSTLLLFTDGLVERPGEDLSDGIDRLCRVLAAEGRRPLEELLDASLARILGGRRLDDVAVLAVRAHSEHGPRPPQAGPSHGAGPADLDGLPPAPDATAGPRTGPLSGPVTGQVSGAVTREVAGSALRH